MTSMRVLKKNTHIRTKGSWIRAASKSGKGDLKVSLTRTVTSTHGHTVTRGETASITRSIQEDLEFGNRGVSRTYSTSLSRSANAVMTRSVSETCSATCHGHRGGVAIFQWHTYTEGIAHARVKTCDFVCRTGRDVASPPKCPPGACKDGECNHCRAWAKRRGEEEEDFVELVPNEVDEEVWGDWNEEEEGNDYIDYQDWPEYEEEPLAEGIEWLNDFEEQIEEIMEDAEAAEFQDAETEAKNSADLISE